MACPEDNHALVHTSVFASLCDAQASEIKLLPSEDALAVDQKLHALGMSNMRKKVDFALRFCKWVTSADALLKHSAEDWLQVPAVLVGDISSFCVCTTMLQNWQLCNKELAEVATCGMEGFDDRLDFQATLLQVMPWATDAVASKIPDNINTSVAAVVDKIEACCPQASILDNPQMLRSKELQQVILSNPQHKFIAENVQKLHDFRKVLQSKDLLPAALKTVCSNSMAQGRKAIGVEYALKKICEMETAKPEERAAKAAAVKKKIGDKQVASHSVHAMTIHSPLSQCPCQISHESS